MCAKGQIREGHRIWAPVRLRRKQGRTRSVVHKELRCRRTPGPYSLSCQSDARIGPCRLVCEQQKRLRQLSQVQPHIFSATRDLSVSSNSDNGNPQLRAKARRALSSWLDGLQSIAEEGQRRGQVRSDVDSAKIGHIDCQHARRKLDGESPAAEQRSPRSCVRSSGGIPRSEGSCAAIENRCGQVMSS